MRVFSTLVFRSNENKSNTCMRVDKREFVRDFSQLTFFRSNENKSCMTVDESWQARGY